LNDIKILLLTILSLLLRKRRAKVVGNRVEQQQNNKVAATINAKQLLKSIFGLYKRKRLHNKIDDITKCRYKLFKQYQLILNPQSLSRFFRGHAVSC